MNQCEEPCSVVYQVLLTEHLYLRSTNMSRTIFPCKMIYQAILILILCFVQFLEIGNFPQFSTPTPTQVYMQFILTSKKAEVVVQIFI